MTVISSRVRNLLSNKRTIMSGVSTPRTMKEYLLFHSKKSLLKPLAMVLDELVVCRNARCTFTLP
uniref:Uncharacterized protein n=1 Tax=Candidatus Kentrum sp. MB TaxID=2138164 RepID=A0A451BCE1_9GAMM|nr:MAG: hypothetical protein BECKMB1821G_GA0114241_103534 [Candidatus Kentron sp. MB]VFK32511.1 MAG: hypothetical protein BECKMB1821I_GA0114274_10346 [Candidatus Kentron sp. MB]VFK75953.1 MAG: hypothetical protein BECKMB1821H_GA0114242_10376 [Candidatus Kentron sp. MB]